LAGANLRKADLRKADLRQADLRRAELGDAELGNTNLSDTNLGGVNNLTQAQLDQACGKPKALPPGLTLDKPCPEKPPVSQKAAP
jgi:hypothetical protein